VRPGEAMLFEDCEGARLPAHLLQYGLSAEDVANLITAAVVEAPTAP